MILTERDIRLIKDVVLSHVLARDQILKLGYFSSQSRLNRRLRDLVTAGYAKVLVTPFSGQNLYQAGCKAREIVGDRIAALLRSRSPSPRFLQHALAVTNIRIALLASGFSGWRFEPQLRHGFTYGGRHMEVRPDGMASQGDEVRFIEADLGHVSEQPYAKKLRAYEVYVASGAFEQSFGQRSLVVQTVTTGSLRKSHLAKRTPGNTLVRFEFQTFSDLGLKTPGDWS